MRELREKERERIKEIECNRCHIGMRQVYVEEEKKGLDDTLVSFRITTCRGSELVSRAFYASHRQSCTILLYIEERYSIGGGGSGGVSLL